MGTLWAWLAWWALGLWLSPAALGWLLLAALPVGWWASRVTARALGGGDPGCIVIDEIVAFWLVLWLLLPAGLWTQFVAFALFRLFDAWKPGPVRWADQAFHGDGWRGAFGIDLDGDPQRQHQRREIGHQGLGHQQRRRHQVRRQVEPRDQRLPQHQHHHTHQQRVHHPLHARLARPGHGPGRWPGGRCGRGAGFRGLGNGGLARRGLLRGGGCGPGRSAQARHGRAHGRRGGRSAHG